MQSVIKIKMSVKHTNTVYLNYTCTAVEEIETTAPFSLIILSEEQKGKM